jgi:hypothetical protein
MKFRMPRTGEVFERLHADPNWTLFGCPRCKREWFRRAAADCCFLCDDSPVAAAFRGDFDPDAYAFAKGRSGGRRYYQ